jgi:hypothetical protein
LVLLLTVTGPLYNVPAVSLGAVPSVVYRIDAPVVRLLIVTVCAELYAPPGGLKVGGATTLALLSEKLADAITPGTVAAMV